MDSEMKCQYCGTKAKDLQVHLISVIPLRYVMLCKYCHDEVHGKGLRLIQVFKEHKPIITGGSQHGRYKADFQLVRTRNKIELEKIKEYVRQLNQKFPNERFYVRKIKYKNTTLYVLAKPKKNDRPENGRKRIPIYFDIKNQKVYVEEKDIQNYPRLVNYLLMRALGSIGVAKVKYLRIQSGA
jgi:hypothetical protein